jgi:hypothetical protein
VEDETAAPPSPRSPSHHHPPRVQQPSNTSLNDLPLEVGVVQVTLPSLPTRSSTAADTAAAPAAADTEEGPNRTTTAAATTTSDGGGITRTTTRLRRAGSSTVETTTTGGTTTATTNDDVATDVAYAAVQDMMSDESFSSVGTVASREFSEGMAVSMVPYHRCPSDDSKQFCLPSSLSLLYSQHTHTLAYLR